MGSLCFPDRRDCSRASAAASRAVSVSQLAHLLFDAAENEQNVECVQRISDQYASAGRVLKIGQQIAQACPLSQKGPAGADFKFSIHDR